MQPENGVQFETINDFQILLRRISQLRSLTGVYLFLFPSHIYKETRLKN